MAQQSPPKPAKRGTPLTVEERRAIFEWVAADGVRVVAESLGCSEDSIANWLAGICTPFALQHKTVQRRLAARARRDD